MKLLSLLVLLLALHDSEAAPPKAKARKRNLPLVRVESVFRVSEAPVSARAKIFLLAGSSQAASFAREIIDQRRLWLKAGFQEDEIECYYVVPLQEDLNEDQARFLEVSAELSKCHAANVKQLSQHLKAAGTRTPRPEFLYLYVTSHGDRPVSYSLKEAKSTDEDYWALQRQKKYPIFESYHMLVEGLADGTATAPELFAALRAGVAADDLYLTPGILSGLLKSAWADVPKFVVLQGCFSGGFFEEDTAPFTENLLSRLSSITLLSAARHDRSSFGCEPGGGATFFGGIYNELLAARLGHPRTIDWKALWTAAKMKVAALEKHENVSPPSLPQFFSNSSP